MKSLSAQELVSFCEWFRDRLVGAQLQDLWTDGKIVVLQLYLRREIFVLVDLQPSAPLLWVQDSKPRVPKKPKPLTLFLSSHGKGMVLQEVQVLLDRGRSVLLIFGARERTCEVQIDLIPKNPNLTVAADGKQVFWNKPRDLPAPVLPDLAALTRDWELWSREVQEETFASKTDAVTARSTGSGTHERALAKKQNALEAMGQQLSSTESERYRALGEALKMRSEPPSEYADLFDRKKSVAENRERAFRKAKDLERKKDGVRERMRIIENEIAALRDKIAKGEHAEAAPVSVAAQVMKKVKRRDAN